MCIRDSYRNTEIGYLQPRVIFCDHNSVVYLTEACSKSVKLMQWALAIQEFDVKFCYKPGKNNTVADYLSRPSPAGDSE